MAELSRLYCIGSAGHGFIINQTATCNTRRNKVYGQGLYMDYFLTVLNAARRPVAPAVQMHLQANQ